MMLLVVKRINLIVSIFSGMFLICYILFLSLSNSLDFNIEKKATINTESTDEYEQLLANIAGTQSKDFLYTAGQELGLVETTLANGYIDLRNQPVNVAGAIVRNQ